MSKIKIKRKKPSLWYVGSLVQQNFGESFDGHGYALIDLTDPTNIKSEFFDIPNDYGFFTLDIENGNLPPNLPITPRTNVRLRVKNTSPAELKRVLASIRREYRNNDVLVQKLDKFAGVEDGGQFGESLHQGDVRNIQYQNQLITDYLNSAGYDGESIESVLEINKSLNALLNQGETARHIVWKPKKFEFSNMFSYGEDNTVNFDTLEGTCGLFAPNHAGKSAILDALCFCLFDHSFRASKAEQVLNRKKDDFWCKFNFELGGFDYFIEKKAYKYKNGPLKGKLRVDIDFWYISSDGEKISLNGEQRRDTDKIIQSYVGTFDDFILTALSLQQNNSNFIDKTQSERKDLLANFLDLKIFDALYDLANKENRSAAVILEEYQKQDFETKLGDAERLKSVNETKYKEAHLDVERAEKEQQLLIDQLMDLNKQLQPCVAEGLDINQLEQEKAKLTRELTLLNENAEKLKIELDKSIVDHDDLASSLQSHKSSFNTMLYEEYRNKLEEKSKLDSTLSSLKITIANKLSKLEKLKQHEYDPDCKYCVSNVFVQDAIETRNELELDKKTTDNFLNTLQTINDFLQENAFIEREAESIKAIVKQFNEAKSKKERAELILDRTSSQIASIEHKIVNIALSIKTYNENLNILENNKNIGNLIRDVDYQLKLKKIELSKLNQVAKDFHGKIKVAEQTIKDCNKSIEHMRELSEKQSTYELYCRAVCKDGIPYFLISKAVPFIQQYVNNILNQVIDFNIELETDGKNINAFICYDENKWPLELSSGMERFMASLAIRIALIKITNLPKPNFIAIDEGFGVLDSSNLNSMHTLFTYMKDMFKFTLIISHIDVVRDMVDNIITINKRDDFSHISC